MPHDAHAVPAIVSDAQWKLARDHLLVREKRLTRESDALAAERRRLPMVRIEKDYVFEGPDGSVRLVDLFAGRRQLILIHVMFGPDDASACSGCSMTVDSIGHLAHLHARDTTLVLVSRAPQARLEAHRRRMGWAAPWYSSFGTSFNADFGRTREGRERSGVSVFLRQGQDVYRTYFTSQRGDEHLGSVWSFLDLTPYGRQEDWEASPEGWPQTPPYDWWRLHDEYAVPPARQGCCGSR